MIRDMLTNVNFKYLLSCFLFVLISCKNDKINYTQTIKKPEQMFILDMRLRTITDGLKMIFHQKLKNG